MNFGAVSKVLEADSLLFDGIKRMRFSTTGFLSVTRRLSAARRVLVALLIPFLVVTQCCCQNLTLVSDQSVPLTASPSSKNETGHPRAENAGIAGARSSCCDPVAARPASDEQHESDGAPSAGEPDGDSGHCPGTQGCPCATLGHGFVAAEKAPTLGAPSVITSVAATLPADGAVVAAPTLDQWLPAVDLRPPHHALRRAPDTGRAPPLFS